jgi:uncharacterized protein DUF4232
VRVAILLALLVAASSVAAGQLAIKRTAYAHSAKVGAFAPCRGEHLSVRHVSEDAAMGGHNLIDYAFKNDSSSACTLMGYPRFELLDRSGKVRRHGRAVDSQRLPGDETNDAPQSVTLGPGKEAAFRVYYNNGGAGYLGRPCPLSRGVRITAPGTRRSFELREEIRSCRSLRVSAVRNSPSQ